MSRALGVVHRPAALRLFARVLRESLRPQDIVGRFGGEEFVIALPGCSQNTAEKALQRVQERLALDLAGGTLPAVKVSIGVAAAEQGDDLAMRLQLAG